MNINNLSEKQLVELNEKVVARIKQLRRNSSRRTASTLKLGQTVSFEDNNGVTTIGKVMKVKRTKAEIKVHTHARGTCTWNVPMSMLTIID